MLTGFATVVACLHPFKDDQVKRQVRAGSTVGETLESLRIKQAYEPNVFLNGERTSADAVLGHGDLLNVRVIPRGFSFNISSLFGYNFGVDAAFGIDFGGQPSADPGAGTPWAYYSAPPANEIQNQYLGYDYSYQDPPNQYYDNFGGAKDVVLPGLTSQQNRENKGGRIPRLYGKYKIFPVVGASPQTKLEGADQYLYIVYDFGYGPLTLSQLSVADTPIGDLAASVTYNLQLGEAGDPALYLYPGDAEEEVFNIPLLYNKPQIKRAKQEATALTVTVQWDRGLYASSSTSGALATASVDILVEYKLFSATTWETLGTISASSADSTTKREALNKPVTAGLYDLRLTRQTPDAVDGDGKVDVCQWTILNAAAPNKPFNTIRDINGNEVYFSRLEVKAKASDIVQGSLGNISAIGESRLRKWTGSAWTAPTETSNPAWIYADILQGGAAFEPMPDSRLDLAGLKAWADECDAQGLEFNYVFDGEQSQFDALKLVAQAGRAVPVLRDSKWSIRMDKLQEQVVQIFTPRNIIAGSFGADVAPIDAPDYIATLFTNPLADWQQDERWVYADGFNVTNANRRQELALVGVTSSTQCYKTARYQMAASELRPWTYHFKTDIEFLCCNLGELIRLRHDVLFLGMGQGQITSVIMDGLNIAGVIVDAPQTMIADRSYSVNIRQKSVANVFSANLETIVGTSRTLMFSSPILPDDTERPEVGEMLTFGLLGVDSIACVITNIEPGDDFTATITCVDAAPEIFGADTGPIPPFKSNISLPHDVKVVVPVPTVLSVRSNEEVLLKSTDGAYVSRIVIDMAEEAAPVAFYEYQYKPSASASWSSATLVPAISRTISISNVQDGTAYDVRIRNRTAKQQFGEWNLTVQNHIAIGKTTPPPDTPPLHLIGTEIEINYNREHGITVPTDYAGQRIKINHDHDENWERGYILADLFLGNRYNFGGLARGLKTIMVKAVDVAGNEQAGPPAIVSLDFGDIQPANVVYEIPQHPLFLGTISGGTIIDGKLVADDDGSLWWGADDNAPWWGTGDNAAWWGESYQELVYQFRYRPPFDEPKPFRIYLDYDLQSAGYKIEYKALDQTLWWGNTPGSDDEPWWGADDNAPWWGSDIEQPWVLFPTDGVVGDYHDYIFRVTLYSGKVQNKINALSVVVDCVDKVVTVSDIIVAPGGTRIALPSGVTFREIKAVTFGAAKDPAYPLMINAVVVDRNKDGPLIEAIDASQASVAGKVTATLTGY